MNVAGSDETVSRIIADVLDYVALRPDAEDTAEGIANSWMPASHRKTPLAQIESALDLLVRRGALARRVLPDGRCVYGAVKRRHPPRRQ